MNMLPATFSILTDRPANTEKSKGNIFLHWPTDSVNKSFIALLIEEIDPAQQNLSAESSCELTSALLLNPWRLNLFSWVSKLK